MASEEAGFDSLGPKGQEVAEAHRTADYSIVHPETRANIASFDCKYEYHRPKQLRVINIFDVPGISRFKISAELASKYLLPARLTSSLMPKTSSQVSWDLPSTCWRRITG